MCDEIDAVAEDLYQALTGWPWDKASKGEKHQFLCYALGATEAAARARSKTLSHYVVVREDGKLQDDLTELLALLGMPTAAQSRSPHEVFQHALVVLNDRLARSITSASVAAFREALPSPLYGTAVGEVTEAEWRVALEAAVAAPSA